MKYPADMLRLLNDLRAILDAPPAPCPQAVPWDRWLRRVEEHELGPFLARRAETIAGLPGRIRDELRMSYARSAATASVRAVEFVRVIAALKGLDFVLLKGLALIPRLYAALAERPACDVDLLFRSPEDAARAAGRLEAIGYQSGKTLSGHHHLTPLVHPASDTMVELHTNFWTPPLSDSFMAAVWGRQMTAETPAGRLPVLDPAAALVHHALHALSDPIPAPLLRSLFETAWLARQPGLSAGALADWLAPHPVPRALAARALGLAAELFGVAPLLDPPAPGYFEYWCRKRLGWTSPAGLLTRFQRTVGLAHYDRLVRGADPGDRSVLLDVLLEVAGRFLAYRFRPRFLSGRSVLRPGRVRALAAGESLILFDAVTAETHVLDGASAAVMRQVDGRKTIGEVLEQGGRAGIRPLAARRALRAMLRRGILVE